MENRYNKYLKDRGKGEKCLCPFELPAITAIDYYGAAGMFMLLQIYRDDCYLCRCKVDEKESSPKKFLIEELKQLGHGLRNVYKEFKGEDLDKLENAYKDEKYIYDPSYDRYSEFVEYNKNLSKAFELIPNIGDTPLFVFGEYSDKRAVAYALQSKSTKVVVVERKENLNRNSRTLFTDVIKHEPLGTSVPDMPIISCLQPTIFYVPLQPESLDSTFWRDATWRDILPNLEKNCEIAGVACKCITVKAEIDVFCNVFCRVTDACSQEQKITLVYDALNVGFNVKKKSPNKTSSTLLTTRPQNKEAQNQPQDSQPQNPLPNQNTADVEQDTNNNICSQFKPVQGYEGTKLEIEKKQICSVVELFGYYLLDKGCATEICFRDPYLYNEIGLLDAFINKLLSELNDNLKDFKIFKIITLPNEKIKPNSEYSTKNLKEFDANVKKLKERLKKERNVELIHDYMSKKDVDGNHKRVLSFNNGWIIDMEGGLKKLYDCKLNVIDGTCSKTTLYFYYAPDQKTNGKKDSSVLNPYKPPVWGKPCIVKTIKPEDNYKVKDLFEYYLTDGGGTSHVILRDRYLYKNKDILINFIYSLRGITNAANRDNPNIKTIHRFTMCISSHSETSQQQNSINFYKNQAMKNGVEFELKELSKDDNEGDHKRCILFEDNGWCVDLEGGIDKLYATANDVLYGTCNPTTLYYYRNCDNHD